MVFILRYFCCLLSSNFLYFMFFFNVSFLVPSALSLPFHYPSHKDKFFILNRRIQWLLFRMLHLWISRLLSCLFCRIILSLLDFHCCRIIFVISSLCKRLQFRLHKLYFLCRWQVILLCDCISFWCNCIKNRTFVF